MSSVGAGLAGCVYGDRAWEGVGEAFYEVRIVWCLVPCGDGEVRGQVSPPTLIFPAAAQNEVVINKCLGRLVDRDIKGSSNLGKSTRLHCVLQRVILY
jgi:hypothetical protein